MSVIFSPEAPAPIGPYSQAIQWDRLVFTAGQVALGPDGSIVGANVSEETVQVMRNLQAILAVAGASIETVIKTTIFLADMNDFAAVNAVYAEYFTATPPARSTIQVARLPKDARVEIEAIAYIP